LPKGLLQRLVANRVGQIADVKFVSHGEALNLSKSSYHDVELQPSLITAFDPA
jgi:hypothetical protein